MRWPRLAHKTKALAPRTTKPRGLDASTLASTRRQRLGVAPGTVTRKPDRRRERGISRKTIAQGMPDRFGGPVVTNSCAFYFCARGCGRAKRPAFPAPSAEGQQAQLGRISSRERRCMDLCAMSQQSHASCPDLIRASIEIDKGFFEGGWMAGSSPAMTEENEDSGNVEAHVMDSDFFTLAAGPGR